MNLPTMAISEFRAALRKAKRVFMRVASGEPYVQVSKPAAIQWAELSVQYGRPGFVGLSHRQKDVVYIAELGAGEGIFSLVSNTPATPAAA